MLPEVGVVGRTFDHTVCTAPDAPPPAFLRVDRSFKTVIHQQILTMLVALRDICRILRCFVIAAYDISAVVKFVHRFDRFAALSVRGFFNRHFSHVLQALVLDFRSFRQGPCAVFDAIFPDIFGKLIAVFIYYGIYFASVCVP